MLFNSWQFVWFFALVLVVDRGLSNRVRAGQLWLLVASCWFYMAFIPVYLLILATTIAVDYVAGRAIAASSDHRIRTWWLAGSIAVTVGILAVFKYADFMAVNLQTLAAAIGWNYPVAALGILLPIGLSFHTFQSLAYVIEVHRGTCPAERDPLRYALYVMFFPQLVAGPIERPQNLLPQFMAGPHRHPSNLTSGMQLILWGLLKKMAIADTLAPFCDYGFGHWQELSAPSLILVSLAFSLQIWADFSGYSDIARGAARCLGYELMVNFRLPYLATSLTDFWRRWHISLSTWFRDYVYLPLGGNRVPAWRWAVNILTVFAISGLWHGAAWTFVIWGLIHGTAFLIAATWEKRFPLSSGRIALVRNLLGWLLTVATVTVAWVFFRAASATDAAHMLAAMIDPWHVGLKPLRTIAESGATRFAVQTAAFLAIAVHVVEYCHLRHGWAAIFHRQSRWVRWPVYYGLILAVLLLGTYGRRDFIYFQF
ncbi:alginate O-acetyltransferase [Planctomycetota bacterium]|nr:alginate O-acetyltransferase [Planctomycetota bacterium]